MKVLVAIDGLSFSEAVVQTVAERPWPQGTSLHVVSVVDPFAAADIPELISDSTKAARVTVEKAANQLQRTGFELSTQVLQGHPSIRIAGEAKEFGADFVFVGSHGARAITRFLLGSTAHEVVRNAPCSVEIVRVDARNHKSDGAKGLRILMATDGSECSVLAAESVAGRPWPTGSEIRVICAPEYYVPWVDVQALNPAIWEELRQACIDRANEAVAVTSEILKKAKLKTENFVPKVIAGPKAVVLDEASGWSADLVVVGTHGRRGLDRTLLGSFSEAIAMNAHCSVEVIRPRKG